MPDATARACDGVSNELVSSIDLTNKTKRLDDECPESKEPSNDEAPQNSLDFWNTTVFCVDGIFLDEKGCDICKQHLAIVSHMR
jgi:hypothetical protein